MWNDIAKHYKMAWCNQIIYITEYLEGGLTKSGRSLRVHCPIGGMLNSKMMLTHEFPMKFRIKKVFFIIYLLAHGDIQDIIY